MHTFTTYKIQETKQGIEVILYIDQSLTEFSNEITLSENFIQNEKEDIDKEAVSYVKKLLPALKVTTVKVMAGAILLTTIGIGTFSSKSASAAMNQTTQQQENSINYIVVNGDTLSGVAARFGTTVGAIKQSNSLTSDFLQIGQTLVIPTSTSFTLVPNTSNTHLVSSGDSLSAIAKRNGTTVEAIKQMNNLSSDFLRIGQTLTIPVGESSNAAPTTSHSYQVVSGDTLSGIARDNGTTIDAIKQANRLSNDFIRIGQTLTIPTLNGASGSDSLNSTSTTYQVVSGDTLSGIAERNGTTVQELKQLNHLSSDFLRIGQELAIPSGTTTVAPSVIAPEETITAVNQEDLEWLAKMIYSEARGESIQGQIAVGAVIMNRVKSPLFPNTVKEVLFEISNGHYQFTPAQTGSINTATPNVQINEAALRALNGEDPTNGSLYFYNPYKTSSVWLKSRTVSTTIGNHTFAY
jgi:N-acetylmuramoyl-L-alanine amidase